MKSKKVHIILISILIIIAAYIIISTDRKSFNMMLTLENKSVLSEDYIVTLNL